ncbi:MAG: HDOD domain-containing protein [Dehalococcoidia bacterium]
MAELDVLVEEIADLRPLPPIAAQVLQIAEGDTFSAHELAQAISSDPALTARVLRVANSSYYGFPRRITTIRDAVVLLGFRQVRSTLLATSAIRSMPSYEHIEAGAFWRHSIVVGLLAELIARHEGVHQDEAFTAGVLHNVGRLALEQARPEQFGRARELAIGRGVSMHEAERLVLGFTDAEVGGALARRWDFPAELADAIAGHTQLPSTPEARQSLAGIVARARAFAAEHGLTDGVDRAARPAPAPLSPFAATMLAMSPADLPERAAEPADTAAPTTEPVLDQLIAEQGGIEHVLDRAAAFVEHTAASP